MTFNVCVYCGASPGKDPLHATTARRLGEAIAAAGHGLVYGGGNTGLMGAVAEGCRQAGGKVIGIIPEFLVSQEKLNQAADEIIITRDMHERKMTMFARSEAFVALPGGIGTLEELVEQLTWAQLGRHGKPIVLADIGGFWRPLMSMLAHMRMDGFIRDGLDPHMLVAEKVSDIVPIIERAIARRRGETPAMPPM
jgi:uncharacterized protein (TIGR00730 family)